MAVIDNSADAFNVLLDENKERLYRLCRTYSENPEDAKDLFQEVLLQIWTALPKFRAEAAMSTWAYRIALNTCMRTRQVKIKRKQKQVRLESVEISAAIHSDDSADEQRFLWLRLCIHELSLAERALVVLYLEETPYREIAEITGSSENLVAVRIRRIKQKLFKCIKTKEND